MADSTDTPIVLNDLTQTVQLPGMDKPVPVSALLTRDQHLTSLNKIHAEYGEAKAVADMLATQEGANRLAETLLAQGFGHDAAFQMLKEAGSDDQGGSGSGDDGGARGNQGNDGTPPEWQLEALELRRQVAMLTTALSKTEADRSLREEVAEVKKVRPDADVEKLATLAMKLRTQANLKDALEMFQAEEYKTKLEAAEAKIKRMEQEAALPGISSILDGEPKGQELKIASEGDRDKFLRELIAKAAAKELS